MKKLLFLLTVLFLYGSTLHAQIEPDEISEVEYETVLYESPDQIQLQANASVRFEDNAAVYLKWSDTDNDFNSYEVRYKVKNSETWVSIPATSNEVVLQNLPLDTDYEWEVLANTPESSSSLGAFSTYIQPEPIKISTVLFNQLQIFFRGEVDEDFCTYVTDVEDVHIFEKLSFLQAYTFQNLPFNNANNQNSMIPWFPPS